MYWILASYKGIFCPEIGYSTYIMASGFPLFLFLSKNPCFCRKLDKMPSPSGVVSGYAPGWKLPHLRCSSTSKHSSKLCGTIVAASVWTKKHEPTIPVFLAFFALPAIYLQKVFICKQLQVRHSTREHQDIHRMKQRNVSARPCVDAQKARSTVNP